MASQSAASRGSPSSGAEWQRCSSVAGRFAASELARAGRATSRPVRACPCRRRVCRGERECALLPGDAKSTAWGRNGLDDGLLLLPPLCLWLPVGVVSEPLMLPPPPMPPPMRESCSGDSPAPVVAALALLLPPPLPLPAPEPLLSVGLDAPTPAELCRARPSRRLRV